MSELVVCPDCLEEVPCFDDDYTTVLEVHAAQDCEGVA